jgi:hypothetical protein
MKTFTHIITGRNYSPAGNGAKQQSGAINEAKGDDAADKSIIRAFDCIVMLYST